MLFIGAKSKATEAVGNQAAAPGRQCRSGSRRGRAGRDRREHREVAGARRDCLEVRRAGGAWSLGRHAGREGESQRREERAKREARLPRKCGHHRLCALALSSRVSLSLSTIRKAKSKGKGKEPGKGKGSKKGKGQGQASKKVPVVREERRSPNIFRKHSANLAKELVRLNREIASHAQLRDLPAVHATLRNLEDPGLGFWDFRTLFEAGDSPRVAPVVTIAFQRRP